MSSSLDNVADETPGWVPLSLEEFARLERGQNLRDRNGRGWTVTAPPHMEAGLQNVVIREVEAPIRVADLAAATRFHG